MFSILNRIRAGFAARTFVVIVVASLLCAWSAPTVLARSKVREGYSHKGDGDGVAGVKVVLLSRFEDSKTEATTLFSQRPVGDVLPTARNAVRQTVRVGWIWFLIRH